MSLSGRLITLVDLLGIKLGSGLLGGVTKVGDGGELGTTGGTDGAGEFGTTGGTNDVREFGTTGDMGSSWGLGSGRFTVAGVSSGIGLTTGGLTKSVCVDGLTGVSHGLGPGDVGVSGENFLRNCLFLSVILPLPSTLTRYLLNPRSSSTRPDLSHFFETFPAPYWFWIRTQEPGTRGGRSLVCSDHRSAPLKTLFLIASSLFSLQSTQTSDGEN